MSLTAHAGCPYNIADAGVPIEDLVVRQAQVFREKQGIDLKNRP